MTQPNRCGRRLWRNWSRFLGNVRRADRFVLRRGTPAGHGPSELVRPTPRDDATAGGQAE